MMKTKMISFAILVLFSLISCGDQVLEPGGDLVPFTVLEDDSLPFIEVNNVRLHSEGYGNPTDPILLVVHGGPGADYRSQLNFKQLADDGMYVVFYDQRGCGLSQRLDKSGYDKVQVYIDELDGVIDHYRKDEDQQVILAGHSWGAMLATAYVNQNPEVIDGMILAEPGGFVWEQTETYISKTRKLELFAETTNDFVYQDQFITASDHETLDYKFILGAAGDVTTGDAKPPSFWRYGAVCQAASIELAINNPDQMDFTGNLSSYDKKVLFAYSELNPAYGIEHAALVSAPLVNVELVEVLGCGHEMPEFGWNNYYPFIKNYLNEIL